MPIECDKTCDKLCSPEIKSNCLKCLNSSVICAIFFNGCNRHLIIKKLLDSTRATTEGFNLNIYIYIYYKDEGFTKEELTWDLLINIIQLRVMM